MCSNAIGFNRQIRRTNCLVRFLCASGPIGKSPGLFHRIIQTKLLSDHLSRLIHRLLGQIHRIGTHIRNQTTGISGNFKIALVKLLCNPHRLRHRKTQLARRLLLQRRCRKRRHGPSHALALGHLCHDKLPLQRTRFNSSGLGFILNRRFFAIQPRQFSLKFGILKIGFNFPIFLWLKRPNLPLAIDNNPHRHTLHASC